MLAVKGDYAPGIAKSILRGLKRDAVFVRVFFRLCRIPFETRLIRLHIVNIH
jgi:hypothetical protein